MAKSGEGRSTVEYLIEKDRLELVASDGSAVVAEQILGRAELRIATSRAGLEAGDVDGAFVAAYDAYRMSAECLLAHQCLRATGGEGSHMTVEDAVSAQFAGQIEPFAKPTFERFRRTRHIAQYFDPQAAEITHSDSEWAIKTAASAVDGARRITQATELSRFEPS